MGASLLAVAKSIYYVCLLAKKVGHSTANYSQNGSQMIPNFKGGFQGWAEGDEAIAGKWANVPTTPVSEFSRSAYEFQPKMIP